MKCNAAVVIPTFLLLSTVRVLLAAPFANATSYEYTKLLNAVVNILTNMLPAQPRTHFKSTRICNYTLSRNKTNAMEDSKR
uniref:Secreted protein n=1 Tax=Glossina palpalis gambiensis TaxID=67801 RepID=A0A1B0BXJ9_9MUSC